MEEKIELLKDILTQERTPSADALTRREKERKRPIMVKDGKIKVRHNPEKIPKGPILSPRSAITIAYDVLKNMDREVAIVILLDEQHNYLGNEVIGLGSGKHVSFHAEDVFSLVFAPRPRPCRSIILAHNHPLSGDPTPSDDDLQTLETIKHLGILLNRPLRDFIIIGEKGAHYSHRENNLDL